MKKLLIILMLIPFIGFGQSKIRNTQITSGSQPANRVMKSDGATNVNWGNDSLTVKLPFVEFTEGASPVHSPYKLFADTTNHTLAFYNDEEHVTMQVGQEMWSRIYNNGLITIANGTVVRITGSFGGIATISLASNDYHINADGVLGVLTHDVESNTYGFVTTMGEVHELPTSACPEGAIIYLGVNGAYTHIRPLAPNFVVEIGTCLYSHATDGTILVNIKGSPYDIVHNSFNDIFLESMKFTVTSNGTTTIGHIERNGGGDLTMQFSSGFSTLDCTPAATVTLTAGTATAPQTNYVYVPKSTGILTASTSGWPSDEHIKVSEVACRTSALTQSDGVLRNQNWNDHIAGSNGSGHISHINERIRRLNADWFSGITPTFTIVSASTPDNLYFSNTGGKVYQMHLQDFPAQSMPTADIHIVNHFTTPFVTTTDLNTQLTDALGATLASKSYSLVIWGIQNETGELSHLMCNLPIGSYLSAANAKIDADNYSVYTIPNQFKGVGFLIARVTLSHNPASSGTWTLEQVQDLRGYFPNSTAGSGSSGSGGGVSTYLQLLDTPNSYASSANKLQGVNSGETAIESKGVTATLEGTVNIPTGQTYNINGSTIITQTISNGVTTTTSSQDAIFDALALKENLSNKENTTVDNSAVKYPTVNLLKTYADTKEPVFTKNTAFNKNFGTTAGTVQEGRIFGTAANSATTDFAPASGSENYIQANPTSYQDSKFKLGNQTNQIGSNTSSGDDSGLIIARSITTQTSSGSHAIRDESIFNSDGSGLKAYASYDAIPTVSGTQAYNHYNSYQSRLQYNGSGSIDQVAGLTVRPTHSGTGSINSINGLLFSDAIGSGNINYQFGVYVQPLTKGAIGNYGIYVEGSNPSYFGGMVQSGGDGVFSGKLKANNFYTEADLHTVGFGNGIPASNYPITGAGFFATLIGHNAGHNLLDLTTVHNTLIGSNSGYSLTSQSNNTLIGSFAGYSLTGYGNVFIGKDAGKFETNISNTLFITNNDGATPLIRGDFSANTVTIGGTVNSTGYLLNNNNLFSSLSTNVMTKWDGTKFISIADGTNGQVLSTDGFGGYSFTTLAAVSYSNNYNDLSNKPTIPIVRNKTPQTLTGTTPTFNIASGLNAILTLSGNTTITISGLEAGDTGNLTIYTHSTTVYTLNVNGYNNSMARSIGTIGNYTKLNVSGSGSKRDQFSYYYDGIRLQWTGTLNNITQP